MKRISPPVRLPYETYVFYKNMQQKMEEDFYRITGKRRRLPLGKVISISSREDYKNRL